MAVAPDQIQSKPVDETTRQIEDNSVETVIDPTAEEAQRAQHALNSADPVREDAPAREKPETPKAPDPFAERNEIAKRYRADKRARDREYVAGHLNDPSVIAGHAAAENTLRDDPTPASAQEKEPETAPPAPEPRRYKVKVSGQEIEVAENDLVANYQKNFEADRRLQEAERLRREAEQFRAMAQQQAYAQQQPTNREAQAQPPQASAPTQSHGSPTNQAGLSDDEWMAVADRLQMGATDEAAQALKAAFQRAAPQQQQPVLDMGAVGQAVEQALVQREDFNRSKTVLQSFLQKYPGLAQPENAPAQVLVSSLTETEMVKDLAKVGFDQREIGQLHQMGKLRDAHRLLRNDAQLRSVVRSQDAILAEVEKNQLFSHLKPSLSGRAPVSVNVDRQERKAGVQPSPAHRSIPLHPQAQQPSGDRHQIAARKIIERRGQYVGA